MSRRKRVRYDLDIQFSVEAEKDAFVKRLKAVRALISGGEGVRAVDNFGLMSAMFDIVEATIPQQGTSSTGDRRESSSSQIQSFMRNSGKCLAA